ncbi:hypothetical protein KY290_021940 [Solanum tuberosum]|uniref:Uncharacterized protein n=1 Tax=Solanum tuberosum TaxID=4113 RepID=A0ABQ7V302_SOLTU|nr:hypothetical protein KY289_021104 [Solanum tuberosum]KAH0758447.1 hypothetical protein KY290_021940 [Solanum tuberosum]
MLSVNQAYALIVQDESQKLAASSNYSHHEEGSTVFFTSRSSGSKKKNWNSVCYPADFKLKGKNAQAIFVNSQQEGKEGQMAISGDQYKKILLWKQTRDITSPCIEG